MSEQTTEQRPRSNREDHVEPLRSTGPRPRLGFLGVGWIGLHRLEAIAAAECADITALADANVDLAIRSAAKFPGAVPTDSLETLLRMDLDGIVIATPTALHARQAVRALESGIAVFCQKPIGPTKMETEEVIAAARRAGRLLGVDMSYRFMRGVKKIKALLEREAIGRVYALDLVFHNAYGPDKPWYYDRTLAGGGCVIDLGIHLVDLALWFLDDPGVARVSSRLFAQGSPIKGSGPALEDYAVARVDFENGAVASLACSWRLPAGQDAVIRGSIYGTRGGLAFENVNGSFFDFRTEQFNGTTRSVLDEPPDSWGGRAAVAWVEQLCKSAAYDPEIERAGAVAAILDAIYGRKL
ncbi:MAG TPA: Gfo/Idh/MocA family oxidoreductase [Candidatus Binatia bacterium]